MSGGDAKQEQKMRRIKVAKDIACMLESKRERAQAEGRTRMRDGVERRGTNEVK